MIKKTPSTKKADPDKELAAAAKTSHDEYQEAIGSGPPTGAEPVTDPDGNEVAVEDMPSSGVWAAPKVKETADEEPDEGSGSGG